MRNARRRAGSIVAAVLAAVVPRIAEAQVVVPQGAGQADVRALTSAYNASGQAIFRDFASRPGNVVISPYSIGTAMAMALAGARGETEREMIAVLQHSLGREPINDANASAIAILNAYDKSDRPPTCAPGMTLAGERCEAKPNAAGNCQFPANRVDDTCVAAPFYLPSAKLLVANALMLASADVAKDYKALLKDRYAAEVFERASLDTVNGWVKQRTEGKIEKILEKMSDAVLVNAVYFKSRWAVVFDSKLTKPEFFSLTRSRQEMVPTMLQQRAYHVVVAREGYRAIRLPYAVRSLVMVVALPNEVDGIGEVARRLDADELAQMLAALRKEPPRLVTLMLPRFRAEYSANLKDVFQKLGMTLPFDRSRSDFSGLTGVPPQAAPTHIDQIVHKAVIEVSEESTEAAATTAVGIQIASAPPKVEPLLFRVDRPFLYYLVDETTGAVLFQGRVADPR